MMTTEVKKFIEENINLIDQNNWEEVYKKAINCLHPGVGNFTETLLECGINPLELGLNYIPKDFLSYSHIKEFIIPNNITSIGDSAFDVCSSLTSITIPNSVTRIGTCAFSHCINLTGIRIPDSVTWIGSHAFGCCRSLTSITIPDNVMFIGSYALYFCDKLKSVTIPNSVTSIGDSVFYDCTNLKEINYLGTKKEAMQLGIGNKSKKRWRRNSAISKIICTDGEIEL